MCVMELRKEGIKYAQANVPGCTFCLKHEERKFPDRRRVWKEHNGFRKTAAEVKSSQIYCEIIAQDTFAEKGLIITVSGFFEREYFKHIKYNVSRIFRCSMNLHLDETRA